MFQKIQVIGNLGRDIEVTFMPNGEAVGKFSVAATERWKDRNSGLKKEHTEWFNCSLWSGVESRQEYLKKGVKVLVEGRQRTRKWEDREGNDRWSVELLVDNLILLDRKPNIESPASGDDGVPEAGSDLPPGEPGVPTHMDDWPDETQSGTADKKARGKKKEPATA